MRQLIKSLITLTFLAPSLSWGLSDATVLQAIEATHTEIRAETTAQGRMTRLENLRQFINLRLNTIELPSDLLSLRNDDPLIENFRSLNEFEGYLDLISMNQINKRTCSQAQVKVLASATGTEKSYGSSEVQIALGLLNSLCKY